MYKLSKFFDWIMSSRAERDWLEYKRSCRRIVKTDVLSASPGYSVLTLECGHQILMHLNPLQEAHCPECAKLPVIEKQEEIS